MAAASNTAMGNGHGASNHDHTAPSTSTTHATAMKTATEVLSKSLGSSSSSTRSVSFAPTPMVAMSEGDREDVGSKPQLVRVEVLGDEKVGKTSLVCSLVSRHFSDRVPAVLLNVQIPAEENSENVILSITDTSSRGSDIMRVATATKRSDVILLVYDLTRPETIDRLRRWLDLIAHHKHVPVVLIGNKDDIKTIASATSIVNLHSSQLQKLISIFPFAVDGGECSARNFTQVARAFFCAQKAVLYPVEPLFNARTRQLKPACVKAIKRTFRLYDRDQDGLLQRKELNNYQHDCFGTRMLDSEMDTMIEFLQKTIPDGVTEDGSAVMFEGFVFLWHLFIERKRPESCWQALRSFGYNNNLQLNIPSERLHLPQGDADQSAEYTLSARDFIHDLFNQFDSDKDGFLTQHDVNEIFSICGDEEAPWTNCSTVALCPLYRINKADGKSLISHETWLALWNYVANENPRKAVETLFYLGYNDLTNIPLELTKSRTSTRQSTWIPRKLVTCYVFAASHKLKAQFMRAAVGQDIGDNGEDDDNSVIRVVTAAGNREYAATLMLTEELMGGEPETDKQADVLCFLFDPSDRESLAAAETLDEHRSSAIPRLYIAFKFGDKPAETKTKDSTTEASATPPRSQDVDKGAVRQLKPTAFLVEDEKSMATALGYLMEIAMEPPAAVARSKARRRVYSASMIAGVVTVLAIGALIGAKASKPGNRDVITNCYHGARDVVRQMFS